jgi:hypothetical protein
MLLAVSGVLAVGGLVLPSIQQQQSRGDTRILSVVVNHGDDVVLGPSTTTTFGFSITAKDDSGIAGVDNVGIWGNNYGVLRPSAVTCKATADPAVSVCTGTASVNVKKRQIWDDQAGNWHVQATVHAKDGSRAESDTAGNFQVKKESTIIITGVPARARAGDTITVDGLLEQPDWRSQSWVANAWQPIELRFQPKGSSTWQTVKTLRTSGTGTMTADVRVTESGTYQWYYPGKFWAQAMGSPTIAITVG